VQWSGSVTGVSWNRAVDGDAASELERHDRIPEAVADQSPGSRLDGTAWR